MTAFVKANLNHSYALSSGRPDGIVGKSNSCGGSCIELTDSPNLLFRLDFLIIRWI